MTRTPPAPLTLGIVGFGKIAREQHVPAIRADRRFVLHSIADTAGGAAPARKYATVEALLAADDAPAAVAICTPPQARYAVARHALGRGRHVLLEKPPTVTLSELEELREVAARAGVTLFCAWHSQFAAAVLPAREWLAQRRLNSVRITWREDVRVWHPGQRWLWEPGGFGVFDPGINALSVAARILPKRLLVREALLSFPENCATPIAADLAMTDVDGTPIAVSFDFLQTGPQTWNIEVETDADTLLLSQGGARLAIDGHDVQVGPSAEYPALYARFADLIASGRSDADALPLELVADALLLGRRRLAPAFVD
ncbi:MAG TPA: Gfo/Idh/MocA family oxidoreductase [Gammaproteobacteria bacterium]|nr:Gfo/Idh/MocA family oxidoreductase [Gammaproteobacteria bacterium]